jgi:hypothetical protein
MSLSRRYRDVARRLGLELVDAAGDRARITGRIGGLDAIVTAEHAGPRQGRWNDWAHLWIAELRHPRIAESLRLLPSTPDPSFFAEIYAPSGRTGDPVFDREVTIALEPSIAIGGLDHHNRRRILSLFDGGCAFVGGGRVQLWRGSREPDVEPMGFGQDLADAVAIATRYTEVDVVAGLVEVARNDPVPAVQLAATEQLGLVAPGRLVETRRALDRLIDARLKDWADGPRLEQLLGIAQVRQRIDARLGRSGERLLRRLVIAAHHRPKVLALIGELALVRLLEDGERWLKAPVLLALEQRGRSLEALRAARKHTEGLLLGAEVKSAAKRAAKAIESRIGAGGGQLSIASGDQGGLAIAEAGELAIAEDD